MPPAPESTANPEHAALHHAAISAASELEGLLRARGAVGKGLGNLTRSLNEEELPLTLSARLRALATIRNRFVHEPESLTAEHLGRFIHEAADVRDHLDALQTEALREPAAQDAVWLMRELRARETRASFSPPLSERSQRSSSAARLDLDRLDRPAQRTAQVHAALLVAAFLGVGAAFIWALLQL